MPLRGDQSSDHDLVSDRGDKLRLCVCACWTRLPRPFRSDPFVVFTGFRFVMHEVKPILHGFCDRAQIPVSILPLNLVSLSGFQHRFNEWAKSRRLDPFIPVALPAVEMNLVGIVTLFPIEDLGRIPLT